MGTTNDELNALSAREHAPGRLLGLYTAAEAGAPMDAHTEVEVVAGLGIVGDRYATGRGYWSDPRWQDRELTLFAKETADALSLPPEAFRRNLITEGVTLDALIGRQFRVGEVLLFGVRRCDPCRYLEERVRPGLVRELGECGGLRAHVVAGGRLRLNDAVLLWTTTPAAET
jgi:hypothetical protein